MQQYFWDASLSIGEKIELPKDICHQLINVLRFNSGNNIRIVSADGIPFLCEVEISKKKAFANIVSEIMESEEPKCEIILYLAQIKRDKFELALQKCTELGVTKIVPIITKRTVVKEHGDIEKKYLRQKAIVREAAEQSERHLIPEFTMPIKLVDIETNSGNNYVCYERSEERSEMLINTLALALNKAESSKSFSIVIGPEGGFEKEEINFLVDNGFQPVSLGVQILRAETAAMLGVGLISQSVQKIFFFQ